MTRVAQILTLAPGFTLMELMLVVAILGILVATAECQIERNPIRLNQNTLHFERSEYSVERTFSLYCELTSSAR